MKRLRIEIRGVVQGVGFRPFVYGLAGERGLSGFVRNSSAGVEIEVEGEGVDGFAGELRSKAPPLSKIAFLEIRELPAEGEEGFSILPSRDEGESTHVAPDTATCKDCLAELRNPEDRRHLYPFINCTNCGPRYSITRAVPYDRPNTTMASFSMCPDCAREYHDPGDRRFHAQPNACPLCGPRAEFVGGELRRRGREAVAAGIEVLRRGGVLAVKGIGGYHLAAAAFDAAAVARLRRRKRRSNKAFALMAPGVEEVKKYCLVSPEEEALLLSKERPIVLLRRTAGASLPEEVAPGVPELGFMLPYSPLHSLLFSQKGIDEGAGEPNFSALVMTSGNLSEEPVVKERSEAEEKLAPFADAFLHHDRGIFMRVDDSVIRSFDARPVFLRRARGYVPSAIPLGDAGPQVLACGADLKNTFCLTTGEAAVVSQHIGDMENYETLRFFEETLGNLKAVYRVSPEALGHDLHPGYFSTRWAMEQQGINRIAVQHHFAHIASVIAEHGLTGKVIGVALDGSGYGGDGTVWGGEFLLADVRGFERVASFSPHPMPGGEAAARNPWQMALSVLDGAYGGDGEKVARQVGLFERRGEEEAANVFRILENRTLSPLTSGAGRLLEAISSIIGIRDVNTYEGEAAMALEALAGGGEEGLYRYDMEGELPVTVNFSETVRGVTADLLGGIDRRRISARVHNTVAAAVVETTRRVAKRRGIRRAVLTGGVFQNRILLGKVMKGLSGAGLDPYTNSQVPPNDAGISLGQAVIVRAAMKNPGA